MLQKCPSLLLWYSSPRRPTNHYYGLDKTPTSGDRRRRGCYPAWRGSPSGGECRARKARTPRRPMAPIGQNTLSVYLNLPCGMNMPTCPAYFYPFLYRTSKASRTHWKNGSDKDAKVHVHMSMTTRYHHVPVLLHSQSDTGKGKEHETTRPAKRTLTTSGVSEGPQI